MATVSAHSAAPPPPSRTPAGSRAASRETARAPRTMSARGPPAWAAPRTRTHRSIPAPPTPAGASRLQRTVPYPPQLLNGLPQMIAAHELRVPIDPVQGAPHDVLLCRVDRQGEGSHSIVHPIRPH